ncbi:MAG: Fe-S protein assembly co-chaperone HscB [Neisseriales bacterium]|nr:MAG: Fe-S protein assembly co-chaperone HscB [Neisseriales bacterium]
MPKRDKTHLLTCDFFALFEEPYTFILDLVALKKKYYRLIATIHPDRFVEASDTQKQFALLLSSRFNSGWQILSKPLERACYLLSLQNIIITNQMETTWPKAWLEEQIAWHERIDQARYHPSRLKILADELDTQIDDFYQALAALLTNDWQTAIPIVQKWRFFAKLKQEVDDAIQSLTYSGHRI